MSGEKLEVTVQLVKPDYLVVSLPRRKPANPPTLGFLSTKVRQYHSVLPYRNAVHRFKAQIPAAASSRVSCTRRVSVLMSGGMPCGVDPHPLRPLHAGLQPAGVGSGGGAAAVQRRPAAAGHRRPAALRRNRFGTVQRSTSCSVMHSATDPMCEQQHSG